jgi:hypothetical protein
VLTGDLPPVADGAEERRALGALVDRLAAGGAARVPVGAR